MDDGPIAPDPAGELDAAPAEVDDVDDELTLLLLLLLL